MVGGLPLQKSGETAAANADAVWDELTADHVIASTTGLTMRQIKDAAATTGVTVDSMMGHANLLALSAIPVWRTANSISDKLAGMTSGQTVASANITVTDQSQRVSTAEGITTTETPPAASLTIYALQHGSVVADITTVEISFNAGTNYSDFADLPTSALWAVTVGTNPISAIPLGANGRLRWTTPATVGTYIVGISGASIS